MHPLASGALYAGGMYGVKTLMNQPTAPLLSKDTLISGGIQAASSFASDKLQPTIHQFAPPIVTDTLGTLMQPATTGALNLGANSFLKGRIPPLADAAIMFGISAFADVGANILKM
jgi:hypothetical protein